MQITPPSQYRCTQLQYRYVVISKASSNIAPLECSYKSQNPISTRDDINKISTWSKNSYN